MRPADALISQVLNEIAKPAKVPFKRMGPSPAVPEALRSMDFYHGVKTDAAAHKILAAGRLEPGTYGHGHDGGSGYQRARADKVYLTNDKSYAYDHGVGVRLGNDTEEPDTSKHRYAYIFKVSGKDLNNVEADEDSIERTYWNTSGGNKTPAFGFHQGMLDLSKTALSAKDQETAAGVSASFPHRVRVAKKLAARMPADMHHDLILNHHAHIAHGGPVKITGAWRIDKERHDEFHWDGSNFFDIAEPLHHLIGRGLR